MAIDNGKPETPLATTPGNFLISENNAQQTLINILQINSLLRVLVDIRLDNLDIDSQLGLRNILEQVDKALWYEIYRRTPE